MKKTQHIFILFLFTFSIHFSQWVDVMPSGAIGEWQNQQNRYIISAESIQDRYYAYLIEGVRKDSDNSYRIITKRGSFYYAFDLVVNAKTIRLALSNSNWPSEDGAIGSPTGPWGTYSKPWEVKALPKEAFAAWKNAENYRISIKSRSIDLNGDRFRIRRVYVREDLYKVIASNIDDKFVAIYMQFDEDKQSVNLFEGQRLHNEYVASYSKQGDMVKFTKSN